jgi:mono/diheme cytochrome c family protein
MADDTELGKNAFVTTIEFGRRTIEMISMDLRHTFSRLSATLRHAAVLGVAIAHASAGLAEPSDDAFSPEQVAFFESKIRPIFVEHCWKCHANDEKGGLRLDSRDTALAGGDSGPAIVPGKPDESLMVTAVRYTDPSYQMPPSGKLPAAAIKAIEEWVAMGAPYPGATKSSGAGAVRRGEFTVSDSDRDHWAYKLVTRPAVPAGSAAAPIDAFLNEKFASRQITANDRATPRELVRRAWFDLVGLPPPLQEVEAFERDPSDAAWALLIDRLLAMPAYGERWGRHWLDVVRFAQTNGYERDGEKPFAWRYRDWVIAAFNDDMPYDQFIREQVAGDLLEPRTDSSLIASGFWHLGTWDDEPDDGRLARYDELDDMISTVGQGFLATTINCARCHDHKFDPLGQKDYYSLLGMVHSIRRYSPKYGTEKRKKKDTPDEEEVVEVMPDAFAKLSHEGDWALCAIDGKQPPKTHVFIRGNPGMPGAEVTPGIPEVFKGIVPDSYLSGLSGRRALAEWIASPANPLTARVMVNRAWLYHFGRGLVTTPNDFGFAGEPPTHEELLDWLAAEFVDHGWSIKHLHRVIMTSEAYRRSSRADRADCIATDEGNDLFWRQNRRRLEAEAIRDSLLAAAGTLNRQPGGRGFFASLGGDCLAGQSKPGKGWDISSLDQQCRRSVYGFVKRTLLLPELESFDYTNTTSSVGERSVTTVSPQALLLTNGAFARGQAAAMARRIAGELKPGDGGSLDERFVTRAYELAVARRPSAAEREIAVAYLARQRSAWAASADAVSLMPLVPSALVKEYREHLNAEQILAVTPAGWLAGGGVWGGGYEGILNLDPLTGPFALWQPPPDREAAAGFEPQGRFTDGAVEAELFIRGATELAAVVVRGLPEGEKMAQRFTGYELAIVPPLKAIELRKATAKGSLVLAAVKRELAPDSWVHVRLEAVGGRIVATLDREAVPVLTADDPEPLSRPGQAGLRTWGASLEARNMFAHPVGGDLVRLDPAQPPSAAEVAARAQRDLCLLILNLNEVLYVD